MPNAKIYIDQEVFAPLKDELRALLVLLRANISAKLNVPPEACELVIVPVLGLKGQPPACLELYCLAKPDRSKELLSELCVLLRDALGEVLGAAPTVRAITLDPAAYVAVN